MATAISGGLPMSELILYRLWLFTATWRNGAIELLPEHRKFIVAADDIII